MSRQMQTCLQSGRKYQDRLRRSGRFDTLIPRSRPAQAVSEFIESNNSGYLLITGEPGIGKTGLMLDLSRNAAISYFFRSRLWSARVLNFLNYLAAELHLRLTKGAPLPPWLGDPYDAHERADSLLGELGRTLNKGEKLLILLDALDEAAFGKGTNAQLVKLDTPPGIYFICSLRREHRVLSQLTACVDVTVFDWQKDEPTVAEVDRYVAGCVAEKDHTAARTYIQHSASGNFLVASYYLDEWKRGALSFTTAPESLDAVFEDQWENRLLRRARNRELCQDIATVLAASCDPLSIPLLVAVLHHQGRVEAKARDVRSSLADMSMFFKSFAEGQVTRWHPFDSAFADWLEGYYKDDLCEADRALALTFVDILKDSSSPDFGVAAQNACCHLREWARGTTDPRQRNRVQQILKQLVDDGNIRDRVEQRLGASDYLRHFLYEAVADSAESGSIPDFVHFCIRYVTYRKNIESLLGQLQALARDERFPEIAWMGEGVPAGQVRLAYFAILACCSIDCNRHGVLAGIVDFMSSEESEDGFGRYVPVVATLIARLARLQRKDLLEGVCLLMSFDDGYDFVSHYLRQVARSTPDFSVDPESARLFFETSFPGDAAYLAKTPVETLLDIATDVRRTADVLIESVRSFRNPEKPERILLACQLLGDAFVKRRLCSHAYEIMEISLLDFLTGKPEPFVGAVKSLIATLHPTSDEAIRLVRRILDAIDAPDCNSDFVKANVLVACARCLADNPGIDSLRTIQSTIKLAIGTLHYPLFQDYVRVSLAGAAYRQGSYAEALNEVDSVADPLCRLWASALVLGHALQDAGNIPPAMMERVGGSGAGDFSPVKQLLGVLSDIVSLSGKPPFAPLCSQEGQGKEGDPIYPWFCVLAIVDAAAALGRAESATQADIKTIGGFLREGVRLAASVRSERQRNEARRLLLWQVKEVGAPEIRRRVLSGMVDGFDTFTLYDRELWEELARTLAALDDKTLLHHLMEVLANRMSDAELFFDGRPLIDALLSVRSELNDSEMVDVVKHLLRLAERDEDAVDLIGLVETLPELLGSPRALALLDECSDILGRQDEDGPGFELPYSYARAGAWDKAKLHGQRLEFSQDSLELSLRLGYLAYTEGRLSDSLEYFARALQTELEFDTVAICPLLRFALMVGFARAGDLPAAIQELRRRDNDKKRPAYDLIHVCRAYQPHKEDMSESSVEMSLLGSVLHELKGRLAPLESLAARAHFLNQAGLKEQAQAVIQQALGAVGRSVGTRDLKTLWISSDDQRCLSELVLNSDNDRLVQALFDIASELSERFGESGLLELIIESAPACTKIGIKHVVAQITKRINRKGDLSRLGVKLLTRFSSLLPSAKNANGAVAYWDQFIAAWQAVLPRVSGQQPPYEHVCACLAKSSLGAAKVPLLHRLCCVTWNWLRGPPSQSQDEAWHAVTSIVHAVLTCPGFDDKRSALNAVLEAMPPSCENPWIPALVASSCCGRSFSLESHRHAGCRANRIAP